MWCGREDSNLSTGLYPFEKIEERFSFFRLETSQQQDFLFGLALRVIDQRR
jgi:hypothetical protein